MREVLIRLAKESLKPLAAVSLVAGGVAIEGCSSSSPQAEGTIICPTGQRVDGVWVDTGSKQGWASWQVIGRPNEASYDYSVGFESGYFVHVGCGGTSENWEHSDQSDNPALQSPPAAQTGQMVTFECGPESSQAMEFEGICKLEAK